MKCSITQNLETLQKPLMIDQFNSLKNPNTKKYSNNILISTYQIQIRQH